MPTKRPTRDPAAEVVRLRAELARERRVVAVLREVSVAVGTADGAADFDRILELILARIPDVVDAERATLYLLDEARDELTSRFVSGEEVQTIRVPVGRGIAGAAARLGKTIRVSDAYRDKRFLRDWDEHTGFRTRAILAVPMRDHNGRIVGVVQALNKRGKEKTFSKYDEQTLQALATHAAITIDNYSLYLAEIQKNSELSDVKDQLERKVRELDLLVQLEGAMARSGTLDELVRAALGLAIRTSGASAGALLLPDDPAAATDGSPQTSNGANAATLYFFEPGERRKVRTMVVRPDEGFIGAILANGRAAVAYQPARNGARRLDDALGFSTASAMAAPLEGPEHRLGAIALYHSAASGRTFVDDDLSLLRLIAANVSTALLLNRSRTHQQRAERLSSIGRLLSGVMHDLRSPIAVINGYVQMMSLADDGRVRAEYASHIKRQFTLIEGMQREVLEFARGERTLWVRRVFLQNFLESLSKPLALELSSGPIQLDVQVDDRGAARFDEAKITRAINNLVRNALDAMREQGTGRLGLRVSREQGAIVFSVSDAALGLPDGIRGRLFESFVSSGKKHGTGLGLAIVKRIVEEHHGRVEVQSSPRGTTFRLILPQTEATAAATAP